MKKFIRIGWKVFVVLLVAVVVFASGYLISNKDELITSKYTLNYFEKVVNENNDEMTKTFVARSENDELYNNFEKDIDEWYYFNGVSDFKFKIVDKELFGSGEYRCYFSSAVENYIPKCMPVSEGNYVNYLIDIEISYTMNEKHYEKKQQGMVAFVEDMSEGNYFNWKLVQFTSHDINE